MAFTRLVSTSRAGTGTTSGINTVGCTLLVIGFSTALISGDVPTDSQSNTWIPLGAEDGTGVHARFYYCSNPATSATHTVSTTGGGFPAVFVAGYATAAGMRVVRDVQTEAAGSGTSLTVGPVTPRGDGRLVLALLSHQLTTVPTAASFTTVASQPNTASVCPGGVLAEEIQTTATARSAAWTVSGSGNLAGTLAAFAEIPDTVPLFLTRARTAGSGGTTAVTTALDSTGAGLIVVGGHTGNLGVAPTLADSLGNTWVALTTQATTNTQARLFYCLNPTVGASHTFTVTGFAAAVTVTGWTGAWTYDQEAGAAGTATTRPCGTVTPAAAGALVVAVLTSDLEVLAKLETDQIVPIAFSPNTPSFAVGAVLGFEVQAAAAAVTPTYGWIGSSARETTGATAVWLPVETGSRRNLLTGADHTVDGSDNLIAGVANTVTGDGSQAHGEAMTVTADRSVGFGLDGDPHTLSADGTFCVWGDVCVHGPVAIEGDTVFDGDVTVLGTLTAPGVPGAPPDASYVTLSADSELTAERVLTGSGRVSVTDGGPGSTVTLDVPNDGITYAKIQNVTAASRLLGRGSSGGSGDVEELTLGTGLSLSGTTLSATGGASSHYDCPLSDGDLTAAEIIFAAGECVIVQVPV